MSITERLAAVNLAVHWDSRHKYLWFYEIGAGFAGDVPDSIYGYSRRKDIPDSAILCRAGLEGA